MVNFNLPHSNWTEIVQNGMPYRAQHERHKNRKEIVEEYDKKINDAVDYLKKKAKKIECARMEKEIMLSSMFDTYNAT
jgi:hypothetical protein